MSGEVVTITRKEYFSLIRKSLFLSTLEAAGIDNTDVYRLGCKMFYEEHPEYGED